MARLGGKDRGIVFKDGKWWVRLFINGREKWFRAENKTQAKALYGRLRADIREGKYFPEKFDKQKDISLRAWIDRYLEGSTNRNLVNEKRHGRFWKLLLGKRTLGQITIEDCRRTQAKIRAKGKWKPATINRYMAFLRRVLMVALKEGKISQNPVSSVKFFPEAEKVRFLTDEELLNLRKHLAEEEWKLVAFAVETGIRREEQFHLRWNHISFEAQTLTIPLPKGGRTRHVPLSTQALEILRSLDSILNSPFVFAGIKDPLQPMDSRAFMRRAFEPALRKAAIQGASWHTLRHTTASRLAMAGVPIRTIQEILGHRDIGTTLKYTHLAPSHLKEAIQLGSLANLESRTGSKTGSEGLQSRKDASQVVDLMARQSILSQSISN
ncbi:tyrosine-type recombinase/integrase [Candidatus Nitronereus thalassa]|uniref:Tyrosine-type recombinase/integrase n=1 Tax=Candidatus Nitronereus thalassa TaxID=3020898 RepID=A0ABU3K903_9BACT|nr:tyrosine-type recombinase/integrase [Candidatus Nitronereus thalassa]MDT7042929.1 tyrosine-type recombinase/integrase [Candidatus Nitronereus thalassa]